MWVLTPPHSQTQGPDTVPGAWAALRSSTGTHVGTGGLGQHCDQCWEQGIGSLPRPHAASVLVGFPLKLSCRALVGRHILPTTVEQADPERCVPVHGERADLVYPGELR